MKEPKKTFVGAAVWFERLADDGWAEDVGRWPIDACAEPSVTCSYERVERPSRSPFGKCWAWIRKRCRRAT